jgi:hypothetical protein
MARDPETFARAGLRVREDLAAALVLDESGARALAADAAIASDDENRFATHSPRVLGRPLKSLEKLLGPYEPLASRLEGLDGVYVVRQLVQRQRVRRAQRIAKSLPTPLERTLAEAEIAFGRREPRRARDLVSRALAIDPFSEWGRYRALSTEGDGPDPAADGGNGLIVEARRLHAASDWQGLARIDERLARRGPRDPASVECLQLRVDWRIGSGDGAASAEAVELIDLAPFGGAELLARRALAGAQAARPGVASQSLEHLASQLSGRGMLTALAVEWALAALDSVPEGERSAELRGLKPRLVRMRDRKSRPPA